MKPKWIWTHTGAGGEKLCECEGKLYTEHAWDNFLEAYKGRATKRISVHPPRAKFDYFSPPEASGQPVFYSNTDGDVWPAADWSDLEITLDLTPNPKKP